MLAQAVEAELAELLARHADCQIDGKRSIVRNGYLPERVIQTGLGEVPVKIGLLLVREQIYLMVCFR